MARVKSYGDDGKLVLNLLICRKCAKSAIDLGLDVSDAEIPQD